MSRKVVKIFPATFDAFRLPFLISLRRPDTVMVPLGNATRTANSSGSGVVGEMFSGMVGMCGKFTLST